MKVIKTIQEYLSHLPILRQNSSNIGLVPTMGALHKGHLSLIDQSCQQNDITVCSIFVNPLQFNDSSDLNHYPRDLEKDLELLSNTGCDVVFAPTAAEMYATKPALKINFGYLENILEGCHRPGHFNGVGVVVSKLFNILQPNNAYFGQKDLQQVAIIKKLVQELSFPIHIVVCPIVRESNGLALSSRNARLSTDEKEKAAYISTVLKNACTTIQEHSVEETLSRAKQQLEDVSEFTLEYLECVHSDTFQHLESYTQGNTAFCVALQLGNVRLIDNMII